MTQKRKIRCWNTVRLLRLESLSDWRNCVNFFFFAWQPGLLMWYHSVKRVNRRDATKKERLPNNCSEKQAYLFNSLSYWGLPFSNFPPCSRWEEWRNTKDAKLLSSILPVKPAVLFSRFQATTKQKWSARRARRGQVSHSPENAKKAPVLQDKQHATKLLTMLYFHNFWKGVSLVIKE